MQKFDTRQECLQMKEHMQVQKVTDAGRITLILRIAAVRGDYP
jgi:hypothetical protein